MTSLRLGIVMLLAFGAAATAQGGQQVISCGSARDGYTIEFGPRGMTLRTYGRYQDGDRWRTERSEALPLVRNPDEDQGDWVGFTASDDWNYYRIHLPREVIGKASPAFTSSLSIKNGNHYSCRSRISGPIMGISRATALRD